jgi:DNA-binding transcriptional MerR regulator
MGYTINQLAKLAGVSVRTLHHYDAIGLLKPAHLLKNGYRQYEEPELLQLQQILFFRELEFPLDDIKRMMASPTYNAIAALREHKAMLKLKQKRFEHLIKSIDQTIKTMTNQEQIKVDELYDPWKDDDVKQYQAEVKDRWGNTDAYKQSQERIRKLTKAQMDQLKADGKKHMQALADAMPKGISHPDVQALIKQSHAGVNFFYDCSLEMFRNLGKMYVEDPRFTATYDAYAPGLAQFVHEAIDYYCDHQQ